MPTPWLTLALLTACGNLGGTKNRGAPIPCPPGEVATGQVPSGSPTPPSAKMTLDVAATTRCGNWQTTWYSNDQRRGDFYDGPTGSSYIERDPWGRVVIDRSQSLRVNGTLIRRSEISVWKYHENGVLGVSGTYGEDGATGVWREWDDSGTEIGKVQYHSGVPGKVAGSSTLLLNAPRMASDWGEAPRVDLPVTSSTEKPQEYVMDLVLDRDIVVSGEWVLDVPKGEVPPKDLRGLLISKLYDRLLEHSSNAKELGERTQNPDFDFDGRLRLRIDRSASGLLLKQIVFTAGQAQYSNVELVGRQTGLQWPPRTGPKLIQGAYVAGRARCLKVGQAPLRVC